MNKQNKPKTPAGKPRVKNPVRESRKKRRAAVRREERHELAPQLAPVSVAAAQKFGGVDFGKSRSTRLKASEMVSPINGSVAFSARKFPVNPGVALTFPRLSVEAAKWEQYRFRSLQFRYVTRSSTSDKGSVILSPDYNVRDPTPTTEQQATNTQDAIEDSVWKEIRCRMDVSAMFAFGPRKLIRPGNVAGELNLYDAANFFLCTMEEADASLIGKLWVDYDVEFFVPQNSISESSMALTTSYGGKAANQTFTTNVAALLQLDSLTADPLGIGALNTNAFTPTAGTYVITFEAQFQNSAAESFLGIVELWYNGANAGNNSSRWGLTVPAAGVVQSTQRAILTFSGSDTISIRITMTGATGTLNYLGGSGLLTFELA